MEVGLLEVFEKRMEKRKKGVDWGGGEGYNYSSVKDSRLT